VSNAFPYDRRLISVCGLLFAHSLRARGQDTAKSHSSKVMNNMWTIQFERVFNEGILLISYLYLHQTYDTSILLFYFLQKKSPEMKKRNLI